MRHPVTHFEDDGFRFIGLREEPLENPLNRSFNRAIDIAISLPVILFVFPVLTVVVWLAQCLQSPGALFHAQTRAGMQNRQFKIYKFRTMVADAEPGGAPRRAATPGRSRLEIGQASACC